MRSVRKLGIFAGVLALGACGGGDGGGGGSTTIDPNQASVVGEVAASQISGMAAGLTNFSASGSSLGGGFFAPAAPGGRLVGAMMAKAPSAQHRMAFAAFAQSAVCTPTESDSTDSDGDGVADDNLWTWNCSEVDSLTGNQWNVTGTIRVQDTRDVATGFGYGITFSNFRFATTFDNGQGGTSTIATVVNGTYGADVSQTSAMADQNVTWTYRLDGQRIFLSSWDWSVGFTPSAGTIDWAGADMPAGSFNISGDFAFSGDAGQEAGDWAFSLTSTQPLAYDGSCALEPPFGSGVIEGAIIANTSVGFTITYTGCGQAEVIAAFDDNA